MKTLTMQDQGKIMSRLSNAIHFIERGMEEYGVEEATIFGDAIILIRDAIKKVSD